MSELEDKGAPAPEVDNDNPPVVADYTESMDREEAHAVVRERRVKPPKADTPKADKKPLEERYIPLKEALDDRERRQRAEQERDQYRRQVEEHNARIKASQEEADAPDMFKDPAGYTAWVKQQGALEAKKLASEMVTPLKQQLSATTVELSKMRAVAHLGEERFKPFGEWIDAQSDELHAWAMTQPDPYEAMFTQYRTRTTFERLGSDDLDTFLAKQKAEWEKAQAAPVVDEDEPDTPHVPAVQPTPRSFAATRSSAGDKPAAGASAGPKSLGAILAEKKQPLRNRR